MNANYTYLSKYEGGMRISPSLKKKPITTYFAIPLAYSLCMVMF